MHEQIFINKLRLTRHNILYLRLKLSELYSKLCFFILLIWIILAAPSHQFCIFNQNMTVEKEHFLWQNMRPVKYYFILFYYTTKCIYLQMNLIIFIDNLFSYYFFASAQCVVIFFHICIASCRHCPIVRNAPDGIVWLFLVFFFFYKHILAMDFRIRTHTKQSGKT